MSKAEKGMSFTGLTSGQRDFVLAITNALAKYGPEDGDSSGNVAFLKATDSLISETVRLDYALRTVGSGGPGMERANVFRNLLRDLRESLSDSNARSASAIAQTMRDIDDTTEGLHTALEDFIGITFNEKLMDSLNNLRNSLKKHYTRPTFYESTTELEHELAVRFTSLQQHLQKFVDEDIRNIKSVQNDANQGYVNLTVIATFLSGVTASVLQIVGPTTSGNSVLAVAVNASLFSSLVFSTASAAQSLLAMMWMQSFVRLPEKNLPHLLYAWLRRGPLISLLVSGALFAVGLIVFVYSSHQDPITSAITTCFAIIQTLGVLCLTILFVRDRWRFRRERGITGLKLTKFSILFSTIEGVERVFQYFCCSPRVSPELQRRDHGYSRPPTYGSAVSSFKIDVSEAPDYLNYENLASPPDFVFFNPTITANGPASDQKKNRTRSRSSRDTGREPLDAVNYLSAPTQVGIQEIQHFTPMMISKSGGVSSHTNAIAPAKPGRLPPTPSTSVREVQHFTPTNISKLNNNSGQAAGGFPPLYPAAFDPPFARPSASRMEISHFGKQNSGSKNAIPALPGQNIGSDNPITFPKPPPPALSATVQEQKHFDPRDLAGTNNGNNRSRNGNNYVRFAPLLRPDDPVPILPSSAPKSKYRSTGIQETSAPSAGDTPKAVAAASTSVREMEHFGKRPAGGPVRTGSSGIKYRY